MYSFNELRKLSKKTVEGHGSEVKLAVLADSASQFLCTAIKGYGITQKVNYQIWEADYNQIDGEVFDADSKLYTTGPDYILILRSSEHLINTFYATAADARDNFANQQIAYLQSLVDQIGGKAKSKIILNTYFEINDAVFGNYATKVTVSFLYQLRLLNVQLMQLARENKNVFLLDLASIVAQRGYMSSFDPKLYISSDIVFNLETLP